MQVVSVIVGRCQEATKLLLVAEVEEDALGMGAGKWGTGDPTKVAWPGPAWLTLSRRLLQKAMSGSLSLLENTTFWGSSVRSVAPRIR